MKWYIALQHSLLAYANGTLHFRTRLQKLGPSAVLSAGKPKLPFFESEKVKIIFRPFPYITYYYSFVRFKWMTWHRPASFAFPFLHVCTVHVQQSGTHTHTHTHTQPSVLCSAKPGKNVAVLVLVLVLVLAGGVREGVRSCSEKCSKRDVGSRPRKDRAFSVAE